MPSRKRQVRAAATLEGYIPAGHCSPLTLERCGSQRVLLQGYTSSCKAENCMCA